MSDRPTPNERKQRILNLLFDMDCFDGRPRYHEVDDLLDGCVIVHPDDFVDLPTWHDQSSWNKGYNQALEEVFAGRQETTS